MKKVCIFDLDGTLLDTLESLYVSVNETLSGLGMEAISRMQVRAFVGNGARYLIERSILASGEKSNESVTEITCDEELLNQGMNIYKEVFAEKCMYQVEPYEGVPEVLASLKAGGIRLAILSNKPHQRTVEIANSFFGEGYFDYVQGQCDTVPRKPDPESLGYVMRQLGVEKEDCVYIGDSETDLTTGERAGVATIGVSWGFRDRDVLESESAVAILDRPLQILECMNHMNETK